MNILIYNWRDLKHDWVGGSEVYIFELAKNGLIKGIKLLFSAARISKKIFQAQR